jgi:PPK2 family polyphosphate:nucleotide phosphotransferase
MSHTNIKKLDTRAPKDLKKSKIIKENAKMIAKIQAYQYKMFAESKRSVLIVLQWLDASGKDGVVKYIFSGMNPLWTRATSFRVPTKEELSHDFLWRIHQETPAHGTVQIFNRSHYEDILVPSVEKLLDKKTIEKRYDQINDFEKMLEANGTTIVKFYLNISKEKQKEKLNERLTDPTKYWKHNIGDWDTRDNYDEYIDVYEKIFTKCSQPERNIIAADQNRYKIYQICKVLIRVFEKMELRRPKLSPDQETSYLKAKAELAEHRDEKELEKEKLKEAKKQAKKLAKKQAEEAKKAKKAKAKADKKAAKEKAKIVKKQAEEAKKTEIKAAKEKAKLVKKQVKGIKNPQTVTKPVTPNKTTTSINKPIVKNTTAAAKKTPIAKNK